MHNNVLVKFNREPLFGLTRKQYIELLKEKLKDRVIHAYIFGSFNSDNFNKHSDIDIILIANTNKPFTLRAHDFLDLMDIVPSTDILVYTPEEFKKIIEEESVGFWKSVKESMVEII